MQIELINEERGVAAIRYKDVIDEIYNYISNYIENKAKNGNITNETIIIPQNITDKIYFLDKDYLEIKICLQVHDNEDNAIRDIENGTGYYEYSKDAHINPHGKLTSVNQDNITINLFVNKQGDIYKKCFFGSIYHELNHVYELYKQLLNKKNNNRLIKTRIASNDASNIYKKIRIEINNNNNLTQNNLAPLISEILYFVHSKSEKNAFISNFYGDLKDLHSKRNNFKQDILKSKTFKRYVNAKKIVNYLDNKLTDTDWDELFYIFLKNGVIFTKNPDNFKDNFIKKTNKSLKIMYKKLLRAASLYYDSIDDINEIIEHEKKKHFGTDNYCIEGKFIRQTNTDFDTTIIENIINPMGK